MVDPGHWSVLLALLARMSRWLVLVRAQNTGSFDARSKLGSLISFYVHYMPQSAYPLLPRRNT